MRRIAEFEKVSFEQFEKDWLKLRPQDADRVKEIYDGISLPVRATQGSAGYDFASPVELCLNAGESVTIPTGIRARIESGFVLLLFPRSSLGFRYRMQLNNTVGVIDSDYYEADNEGHIMCRITNDSHDGKEMKVAEHQGFVQGIFLSFGITDDDCAEERRTGGLGSTDKGKCD